MRSFHIYNAQQKLWQWWKQSDLKKTISQEVFSIFTLSQVTRRKRNLSTSWFAASISEFWNHNSPWREKYQCYWSAASFWLPMLLKHFICHYIMGRLAFALRKFKKPTKKALHFARYVLTVNQGGELPGSFTRAREGDISLSLIQESRLLPFFLDCIIKYNGRSRSSYL